MSGKLLGIKIVIALGIILLLLNISGLEYKNLKFSSFYGIISNLLLILAMILAIRNLKKKEK